MTQFEIAKETLSRGLWNSPNDDPLSVLNKLAEHPHGLELLQLFKEVYHSPETPTNQLIKGRANSRVVLIDALSAAKEQLIIVSPWLSKRSIDEEILLRMTALLERGCCLHIGWGYSYDIRGLHSTGGIIGISESGQSFVSGDRVNHYSAFADLAKLSKRYPNHMELKLMGTHEKYLICDHSFALVGSHNVLSSQDTLFAPREMGWKTTDQALIEAQIEDFMNAPDLRNNLRLSSEFNSHQKQL